MDIELVAPALELTHAIPELPESSFSDRVEYYPLLTFWYHIPPSELLRMPPQLRNLYMAKLPELIASKQRMDLTAAAFPHLDKDGRDEILQGLTEMSEGASRGAAPARKYIEDDPEEPTLEFNHYLQELTGMGVTIVEVRRDADGKIIG